MAYRPPGRSDQTLVGAQRWGEKGTSLVESAFDSSNEKAADALRSAIDCFQRSLAMLPDNPEMFYHLGFASFMLLDCIDNEDEKRELAGQASEQFAKLLELRPDDEHILDLLGGALFRCGSLAPTPSERLPYFDQAIEHLERLVDQSRNDPEVCGKTLVSLALCYAHRGANSELEDKLERFENAVRYFEDAIECDAVDFMMRYNYAAALLDAGKYSPEPNQRQRWYDRSLRVHQEAIRRLDQVKDGFVKPDLAREESTDREIMSAIATGTASNFRYNYACLLSLMRRDEQAIGVLKTLIAEDEKRIDDVREDPDFDRLRGLKAFQDLLS